MASAADVPNKYDLVIGSNGYILANAVAPNLPFRTQRARYGYTPTFIERTNVSGDYGDNQQDFWLTATQRDWSGGQGQSFFRSTDPLKARQFANGDLLDLSIEGQVSTNYALKTATAAAALSGASAYPSGGAVYTATATNLIQVALSGTQTSLGAHGAGAAPTSVISDGVNVFMSGPSCTSVRKLVAGVFSAFCATAMDCLAYNNNTIYGCKGGTFYSISTGGVAAPQFTFKDGLGTAFSGTPAKILPFGGKMVVLKDFGNPEGAELFIWDGSTSMSKVADFPATFAPTDMCVNLGTVFVAGVDTAKNRVVVYSYDGSLGQAYEGINSAAPLVATAICSYGKGFMVADGPQGVGTTGQMVFCDDTTGAAYPVAGWDATGTPYLATAGNFVLIISSGSTTSRVWQYGSGNQVTGFFQTSDFDLESSLVKVFRGFTVNFVAAAGATVDVSYAIDDGSVVSLATGVTSGTEVKFPANTTGVRIAFTVTMNVTGSAAPVVTRTYVRAAPLLTKFRIGEYVVDMSGAGGKTPIALRNGNFEPRDGQTILNSFIADVTGTGALTITDHLGTFSGIVELGALDVIEIRPKEYMVRFSAREI